MTLKEVLVEFRKRLESEIRNKGDQWIAGMFIKENAELTGYANLQAIGEVRGLGIALETLEEMLEEIEE